MWNSITPSPHLGGVVHTHSSYATSWAQAGRSIPCYGTTHADYIYGEVPCLRCLTREEIDAAYEKNTGVLIVSEFARRGLDPMAIPAVLCKNHGPFARGKDPMEAVHKRRSAGGGGQNGLPHREHPAPGEARSPGASG